MKPRARFLLSCLAFAFVFMGALIEPWNPLLTLQDELDLCASWPPMTPRWVVVVLSLPAFVVPALGGFLSFAAFGASMRRGHRPAVAPALAGVVAASLLLGVGGLLTWVTHLPLGPRGVVYGTLHAGWLLAYVAPAVLLGVPLARLRAPAVGLAVIVVVFFCIAKVAQRNADGCRHWASPCAEY